MIPEPSRSPMLSTARSSPSQNTVAPLHAMSMLYEQYKRAGQQNEEIAEMAVRLVAFTEKLSGMPPDGPTSGQAGDSLTNDAPFTRLLEDQNDQRQRVIEKLRGVLSRLGT